MGGELPQFRKDVSRNEDPPIQLNLYSGTPSLSSGMCTNSRSGYALEQAGSMGTDQGLNRRLHILTGACKFRAPGSPLSGAVEWESNKPRSSYGRGSGLLIFCLRFFLKENPVPGWRTSPQDTVCHREFMPRLAEPRTTSRIPANRKT